MSHNKTNYTSTQSIFTYDNLKKHYATNSESEYIQSDRNYTSYNYGSTSFKPTISQNVAKCNGSSLYNYSRGPLQF